MRTKHKEQKRAKQKNQFPQLPFEQLPDWLCPGQARTYLGVSRSKMYELLEDKSIPSKRYGRQFRIPKAALKPEVEQA